MELLWNIFPGFDTLQLCGKVNDLLADVEKPKKNSQEEFCSCRCSTTSPVERETMNKNASRMLNSFLHMQKDLEQDNGHFLVLVQERRGVLSVQMVHKVNGTQWRRNWHQNPQEADIQFSMLQVHCLEVDSKKQRSWKIVDTLCNRFGNDLNCCSHSFESAQSLRSSCRSVRRIRNLSYRTEKPVVGGQSSSSFVLSVIKTQVPVDCDDLDRKDLQLQQCGERIEKLSQQDKLSKLCMDAGFLNVVEIGQYFMTKDIAEFSQFTDSVACREHTLPREEEASQPKGWIPGNTKIGPVLEVATCCWHGKYGVEIRIISMDEDSSHSWVRIIVLLPNIIAKREKDNGH